MPRVRKPNGRHLRSTAPAVGLLWAVWVLTGCATPVAPQPTDVYDPLLHLDAEITELPHWPNGDSIGGDSDAAVPCPQAASKTDGSCCPSGLYWDATSGQCVPAGPTGCFVTGSEDPAACVPRWCFAYLDLNNQPCAPGPEDCRALTAPCPTTAGPIAIGCPAGQAPEPACAPAGTVILPSATGAQVPWQDGAALPALPPLNLLSAPPAAPTPLATPQWCNDGAGAVIDAASAAGACVTTACAIGQRPDPAQPGQCLDIAGPAWTCPPGFVVDGTSCVPDPADCTDPWGGVTAGANVVFVSAIAAAGGTGSQSAPFKTLADAVAALPTGGTIAIGAGVYPANIALSQPITLRGSCTKDVILQGASGAPTVLITDQSASQISHLTITGGQYGVRVEGAIQAGIDNVFVHSTTQGGIYALDGASVTAKNLFILTTLPSATKTTGHGIALEGASLDVSQARLSGNREFGLYGAASSVTAKGLVVDGTLAQQSDNKHGYGVYLAGAGSFSASDLRVTGNRAYGVRFEDKVAASGTNWWIDGTVAGGDQTEGIGLGCFSASVKVTDLRVTNSRMHGIWVVDTDASLSGHNVRVSDTMPQTSDQTGGQGVVVEGGGASAQFSGLYVHNSYTQGVSVAGAGALLGLDFVTISATQPQSADKSAGGGLEVVDGAALVLPASGTVTIADSFTNGFLLTGGSWKGGTVRVQDTEVTLATGTGGQGAVIDSGAVVSDATLRVANSRENGIAVASKGTILKNVILDASLTKPSTSGGAGVLIAEGATVQGRVSAVSSFDAGVVVDGKGSSLTATGSASAPGIVAAFTQGNADGTGGDGIQVTGGGALTATGVRVQDSVGQGIFVYDAGSVLSVTHVQVSHTTVSGALGWGRGISISAGAKGKLSDVQIESSQDVGLFIADTSTSATVDDLAIDGGARGVAVQNRAGVTGHRWRLQNHSYLGLIAVDCATRVSIWDLALTRVGYGIQVANLATARLARVAIVGAKGIGVLVDGSDPDGATSNLELFDVRIRDVTASAIGVGHALVAQAGGILRVGGGDVTGWVGIGAVGLTGTLNLAGVALRTAIGAGIRALDSDVKLAGIVVQAVTGAGWSQTGGAAVAAQSVFRDTTPDGLASSNGIEITTQSSVKLTKLLITGMQSAGLVVIDSDVTGDGLRVSGNAEGLSRESNPSDVWVRSLFFGNSVANVVDPGDIAPSGVPNDVTVLDGSDSP